MVSWPYIDSMKSNWQLRIIPPNDTQVIYQSWLSNIKEYQLNAFPLEVAACKAVSVRCLDYLLHQNLLQPQSTKSVLFFSKLELNIQMDLLVADANMAGHQVMKGRVNSRLPASTGIVVHQCW